MDTQALIRDGPELWHLLTGSKEKEEQPRPRLA
jgi:hypothetical protein